MTLYLLDTNIASHVIRDDDRRVKERLLKLPNYGVAVSAVTQAELLYGVAKRGNPTGLNSRVRAFLQRAQPLPWTPQVAEVYGDLRSVCESGGVALAPLHMMIAAHAVALNAVLVTRDRAFRHLEARVVLETWS